jgi:hypothetical protein
MIFVAADAVIKVTRLRLHAYQQSRCFLTG